MNPLAIAIQGLGFGAAMVAVQGFMAAIEQAIIAQAQHAGGGTKTRRRVSKTPIWLPVLPTDEDESLLLTGVI